MRLFALAVSLFCVLPVIAGAANPASAFLPPVGQTARYRFSDTVTGGKQTKTLAGTLTLASTTANRVQASIAIDGKVERTFVLHVDAAGTLERDDGTTTASRTDSIVDPRSSPGAYEQALILQLSIASRVTGSPDTSESFPVLLDIPWARDPVHPILEVRPTGPDAFAGDAKDTTSINPPHKTNAHILRDRALSLGVGILASQIGSGVGRVAGPVVTLVTVLIASRSHSGDPQPTDITLHISGKLANGRLQALSGDQEYIVHNGKHMHTFSDRWSLTAGGA